MPRTPSLATGLVVLALALTPGLCAQTTGDLIGVVSEDTGQPLTGATVTAQSPSLIGGTRSKVTDETGHFAFDALAVGTYEVHVALDL